MLTSTEVSRFVLLPIVKSAAIRNNFRSDCYRETDKLFDNVFFYLSKRKYKKNLPQINIKPYC